MCLAMTVQSSHFGPGGTGWLVQDQVLSQKWEEGNGTRIKNQVILPSSLQETELRAHHNHTTVSHQSVNWPGMT